MADKDKIKLTPEQIAEIKPAYLALETGNKAFRNAIRAVKLAESERNAASIRLWMTIEEMFPQTQEGNWKYNEEEETLEIRDEDEGRPRIQVIDGGELPLM